MFNIARFAGWVLTAVGLTLFGHTLATPVGPAQPTEEPPVSSRPVESGDGATVDGRRPAAARDQPTIEGSRPQTFGDDAALDRLWIECEDGVGVSCDRLFEESPVGSDYERFGVSCGERPQILDCAAELDTPPPQPEPGPAEPAPAPEARPEGVSVP